MDLTVKNWFVAGTRLIAFAPLGTADRNARSPRYGQCVAVNWSRSARIVLASLKS